MGFRSRVGDLSEWDKKAIKVGACGIGKFYRSMALEAWVEREVHTHQHAQCLNTG